MQVTNEMLAAANAEFKYVKAVFIEGGKEYTFKTTLPVAEGNLLTVPVSCGFEVVECVSVSRFTEYKADVNWVIGIVDFAHIEQMQSLEIKVENLIREEQSKIAEEVRESALEDTFGCEAFGGILELAKMEKTNEALPF